jgi:hypothetical protein
MMVVMLLILIYFLIKSIINVRDFWSRLLVISSKINIFAPDKIAKTRFKRCWSPPDSLTAFLSKY